MKNIDSILNDFKHITLDDLKKVQLLDRIDTKYVFNQNHLPNLLNELKPKYKILKINNTCKFN